MVLWALGIGSVLAVVVLTVPWLPEDASTQAHPVDTLYDGHNFSEFRTSRAGSAEVHGTGCTFSAALAAHLALGRTLAEAAELAQRYVAAAIDRSIAIGKGSRVLRHL